jgi:alkanesulfonate monooxygenase SsuD/methylene tetrahydromethanopterin reductase-like flavin-dependent oxidoreductase (luciferase family)
VKVSMFHLMPHRELPDDFSRRYPSVWVTPPWHELVDDPARVGQYYNWTLDELIYGAEMGFDGICVNEHHQNAYGFMPNPNVMGSVLARATSHLDVAIVQMGATLPTTQPAIRVAEEYAMLDCISGGRLVAGMPMGTPMDANMVMGIPPIEQRDRFREAHELIMRAWQSTEPFAFNGHWNQLPMVNIWPRPIQQPHPPVWIPGLGSTSTWRFAAQHDYSYCMLSFFGSQVGKRIMDGFWEFSDAEGLDRNPYRAGFAQMVCVAETDAEAERLFSEHVLYFFDKCLHVPNHWWSGPGYQDYESLSRGIRSGTSMKQLEVIQNFKSYSYRDLVERDIVIAGSPATVRDKLVDAVKTLRIGNLMVLQQIGSMPHELTKDSIGLFCTEVLPKLRDIWDDEGWENHWWPQRLRGQRLA